MKNDELRSLRLEFCPIMKTIGQIGDKWTLLILRECFVGTKRFDDFQTHLGVSKSVLTVKLNLMIENGLLEKTRYKNEKERARFEYRLSKKGKDLQKILVSLLDWGNQYLVGKNEETLFVVDKERGHDIELAFTNSSGEFISGRDIRLRVGKK